MRNHLVPYNVTWRTKNDLLLSLSISLEYPSYTILLLSILLLSVEHEKIVVFLKIN